MAENVEPPVRLPGMGDAAKPASLLCALLKALGMDPFSRGGPDRRSGEVYHMGNLSMALNAIDRLRMW